MFQNIYIYNTLFFLSFLLPYTQFNEIYTRFRLFCFAYCVYNIFRKNFLFPPVTINIHILSSLHKQKEEVRQFLYEFFIISIIIYFIYIYLLLLLRCCLRFLSGFTQFFFSLFFFHYNIALFIYL